MIATSRHLLRGLALAAAVALPSMAMAQQPLAVTVNPLNDVFAFPGRVIQAPFAILNPNAPAPGTYNPEPAYNQAVDYTADGYGVVRPYVLRETGPRYVNPPIYSARGAIVMRPGARVPDFVNTEPVRNISLAGLAPNGDYRYFVAPNGRIVVLDPTTRQVVRIVN